MDDMFNFNFSTDMSTNEDGTAKVNLRFKDSDGADINVTEQGTNLFDLFETVTRRFDDEYSKTTQQKTVPEDTINQLREENLQLRLQIDKLQNQNAELAKQIKKQEIPTRNVFTVDKKRPEKFDKTYYNSLTDFLNLMFQNKE